MKYVLMTTFLASATMAYAENFEHNEYDVYFNKENFQFAVKTLDADPTETVLQAGIYVLPGMLGARDTNLFLSAEYNTETSESIAAAEYNVSGSLSPEAWAYGSVELSYRTEAESVFIKPTAGVGYTLSPVVAAFAEAEWDFDTSTSADDDGILRGGFNFDVSEVVSIRPSLSTTIEGKEVNGKIELSLNF